MIEIAYLLASFVGIIAMVPQIKQLLITKQSDEFSLGTWSSWAACQCIAFLYSVSIQATAYIIVNIAWIAFYLFMVLLIVKYRKNPSAGEPAYVPVLVEKDHITQP